MNKNKRKKLGQIRKTPIYNNNFVKIKTEEGGFSYLPKCDIRFIDVVPGTINPDAKTPKKSDIRWFISYELTNGAACIDVTPYKKINQAEKVSDEIASSLPQLKPITTITQQIGGAIQEELEPVGGDKQPIGFIGGGEQEEDY